MTISDRALLERWTDRRDAEAFAELVSRHSAMVYNTCLRVIGNAADAQEVTQECFARLVQGVPHAKRSWSSLGGWLHTVATRRALDWRKIEARRRRRDTEYAESVATIESAHGWEDVQAVVDEAVAGLPELLREPVVLHFLQGHSHRDIAKRLGVPRRTITSRIALGVREVRAHLVRRGVAVTSTALGVAITAEAVPVALTESLGRLALAGGVTAVLAPIASASIATTIMGAALAMKKGIAAVLVVLIVAGGVVLWERSHASRKRIERVNAQRIRSTEVAGSSTAATAEDHVYVPVPARPSLAERIGTMLTPATKPSDGESASGALEGRVTVSGRALNGQTIMVMYDVGTQYAAQTDSGGKFALPKLPVGEITTFAMFADDTEGVHRVQRHESIRDGVTTKLDIDFAGGGGIAGQITCDGIIPEDATVRVTTLANEDGTETHQSDTDRAGQYSVVGIPAGPVQILVTATSGTGAHRMRRANLSIATSAIVRYDVDISGGSTVIGNVSGLVSGDRIQIVAVLDEPAVPAQLNLSWWFEMRDQLAARDQVSSGNSAYRLEGLDAGIYTILALGGSGASARDMMSWRLQHAVVRLDGSNTAELDFDLTSDVEIALSVSGAVQGLDDDEKAALIFVSDVISVPSPITDEFLSEIQRDAASTAPVNDDGTFQVRGLEPGTYTVVALAGAHGVMSATELRVVTESAVVTDDAPATLDIDFAASEELQSLNN